MTGQILETILVIEDTQSLREVLCTVLTCEGYEVTGVGSAEEGLEKLKNENFTLVLSDLKLPGMSGLDFLRAAKREYNSVPILVMTAYGSIDIAVEAMKLGATDFITKPFDPSMLCHLLSQVAEHRRIITRQISNPALRQRKFITQNANTTKLLYQAKKVAHLSSSVMILGESGTGKELLARFIHENSPRHDKQFIAVNCGSMPDDMLESEFFGHEAGAFTGATEKRIGLFEIADGGTIFLDEIGNMSPSLQMKLLRVLQESEIKPLGSSKIKKIDTRVISATNCNIEDALKKGKFREDLYYRLGVVILEVLPLRNRKEDIELLANYFVKSFSKEFNKPNLCLTPKTIDLLETYDWPGNIRELENVIEQAAIFSESELSPDCFQLGLKKAENSISKEKSLLDVAFDAAKDAEIEAIRRALTQAKGNKTHAARTLGVSYKTLLNKVKEYKIE